MTEPTESTQSVRADKRNELLARHRAARERRESAALGSDEYRAAAEEVAAIEVEMNRLEEPDAPARA
jgi:hypothetical protein